MPKILYFKTDSVAKMITKEIKDGAIQYEEKKHIVDANRPLCYVKRKIGKGYEPFYIMHWNHIRPAKGLTHDKDGWKITYDTEIYKMTPEMLRKLTGIKILGNMLKTPKSAPEGMMMLMMGIVAGVLIVYTLFSMKILKI
jgi:hypothetical protein